MSARKAAPAKPAPPKTISTKALPTKRAGAKTTPAKAVFAKAKSAQNVPVPLAGHKGDASAIALNLAAEIDRALAKGETDVLSTEALQALMAAVCRCYSAQIEGGHSFPPLAEPSRVTSTDVMVTASGLLKAANLAVFELGMWQSWTGR